MTRDEYFELFPPMTFVPNLLMWDRDTNMSRYDIYRSCIRYLSVHKHANPFYRKFLTLFCIAGLSTDNMIASYDICELQEYMRRYIQEHYLGSGDMICDGYSIEYLFASKQHGILRSIEGPRHWHIVIPTFVGLSGYPDMLVQIQSPPAILFHTRMFVLIDDLTHMVMAYKSYNLEQVRMLIDYVMGYMFKFRLIVMDSESATSEFGTWSNGLTYCYQDESTINDCHRSALINVVRSRMMRRREYWESLY